jgi:hypothetical protein
MQQKVTLALLFPFQFLYPAFLRPKRKPTSYVRPSHACDSRVPRASFAKFRQHAQLQPAWYLSTLRRARFSLH